MGTAHTPGPWTPAHVVYTHDHTRLGERRFWVADSHGRIVPLDTCMGETAEANACLIAAAPDLLKACQEFAAWDENPHADEVQATVLRRVVAAAIAKALGDNF